jgi:hypothetical protein
MGTPRVKQDFVGQQAEMEERVRAMEVRAHHWWRDTEGGLNSNWVSMAANLQAGWTSTDGNTVTPQWRIRSDKICLYGTVRFATGAAGVALILPTDAWPLFDTIQTLPTDGSNTRFALATIEAANGHVTLAPSGGAFADGDRIRLDPAWWPYGVMR